MGADGKLFVARQPIFTRKSDVFGYELLFRSGAENVFGGGDGNQATAELIVGDILTFGLQQLSGGKPAFINFTHELLLGHYYTLLPRGTVIEVLEDVEPDGDVLNACRRLRADGYRLALDDLHSTDGYETLLDLADIVKVDFRLVAPERREPLTRELRAGWGRAQLLAEKVETPAEFREAVELGYDYFQGYFFSRPMMFSGREIPQFNLNLLELAHAVRKPDFDFAEVEAIVKRDVSLSYKMLRFANSAAYGVRQRIKSVKHALVMLGQEEVARAVSLLVIAGLGADRPEELAARSCGRRSVKRFTHCWTMRKSASTSFSWVCSHWSTPSLNDRWKRLSLCSRLPQLSMQRCSEARGRSARSSNSQKPTSVPTGVVSPTWRTNCGCRRRNSSSRISARFGWPTRCSCGLKDSRRQTPRSAKADRLRMQWVDRRQHYRLQTSCAAVCARLNADGSASDEVDARVLDVSGGGLLLIREGPVRVGDRLRVSFELGAEVPVPFDFPVEVLSVEQARVGGGLQCHSKFVDLDPRERESLIRKIYEEQIRRMKLGIT